MKCKTCLNKIADFLLDELPEAEAVLVHEHLNICPKCMKAYMELKGTGRALEAIPEMQPVQVSDDFGSEVKEAARMESQKIIRTLPADKRLRMEMRQAQMSQKSSTSTRQQKQNSTWSGLVFAILAVGLIAAGIIAFYPTGSSNPLAERIGELTQTSGVEAIQKKQDSKWVSVQKGVAIWTGDVFSSKPSGGAYFNLDNEGTMFMGPSSELSIRHPQSKAGWTVNLAGGEMGLHRPAKASRKRDVSKYSWMIQTEAAWVEIHPGSTVYVLAAPDPQGRRCEVRVAQGKATVTYGKNRTTVDLEAGRKGQFWTAETQAPKIEKADQLVPSWRVDLLGDKDLSQLFSGEVHLVSPHADGLILDFSYRNYKGSAKYLADWSTEVPNRHLKMKHRGPILVPTDARFTFTAPLAAPLAVAFKVIPDTAPDAEFELTAYDLVSSNVAVNLLGKEAVIELRNRQQRSKKRVPYRTSPPDVEHILLSIDWEGHQLQAQLTTTAGKTQALTLDKDISSPGKLWFSAFRDSVHIEDLTVKGLVAREWLRKRLEEKMPAAN